MHAAAMVSVAVVSVIAFLATRALTALMVSKQMHATTRNVATMLHFAKSDIVCSTLNCNCV
jgi:Tfp pilus assembly protein FimT